MVIRATIDGLAKLLGCGAHQAETVVREERSARAALSRRGLFVAAGAVAGGLVMAEAPAVAGYEFRLSCYPMFVYASPSLAALADFTVLLKQAYSRDTLVSLTDHAVAKAGLRPLEALRQ